MKKTKVTEIILNGVNNFLDFIKEKILNLANTELSNPDKKKELDTDAVNFIMKEVIEPINFMGFDFLADKGINAILTTVIPLITQKLYDIMKEKFVL